MEPAFEGDTFTFFSLHLRLNLGGYIHFLTRCGWMWPFLIWVCPFFGWVWVGVTLFWLGVVDVGGCDLFLTGCGWMWVDVGECGWVWVSAGFITAHYLLFVEIIDWHLIVSCHSIRKLLALINQSSYLIYFCCNLFNRAKWNKYIWNNIQEITFSDFDFFNFSSFIFKKLAVSLKNTTFQ